ncbi:MAG: hypothetical protein PHO08_10905 [Methylococcales bacterium]|nr:hypothetical protein [Methylococcales bacterium]
MNKLLIAVIAILILLVIIYKWRKRAQASQKPAISAQKNKPANKPQTAANVEPKREPVQKTQTTGAVSAIEVKSTLIVEPAPAKTVTLAPNESGDNLPQDSMLRRHYLTHLRTMIESLNGPRPTDSSLRRHYDSLITTEIAQCSSDKNAFGRLICHYEAYKKALAQQVQKASAVAKPLPKAEKKSDGTEFQQEKPKLSEDSTLKQQTKTSAGSDMPLPPTDSVLRRHYDTMINNELNSLLDRK